MPTEPLRCADALIVDDDGRSFAPRRSPQRLPAPDARGPVDTEDIAPFPAPRPIGR
ncbi:hypothetical protein [Micromonospora sp. DT233]|uniref:hypothetical protein n=1 Tax=Micromonospora sp. DT233 TaxID=3393432 RepID=UPI003CEA167F